jgi:hypothetical protein
MSIARDGYGWIVSESGYRAYIAIVIAPGRGIGIGQKGRQRGK